MVDDRDHVIYEAFDQPTLLMRAIESDAPVPRGSNQTCRQNDDKRSRNRTTRGSSHIMSTGNIGGRFTNTSIGPPPIAWYAT